MKVWGLGRHDVLQRDKDSKHMLLPGEELPSRRPK